ncbi:MAG: ABC transporter permease [Chloroflexi bacterium]|nr:ABC transporter permease [Chloroflexota bacterium]
MMRSFTKLAFVQAKLYLREPMSVFFTLLFGPLLLIMFGFIFGNDPQPMFGGLGHLDISVPTYTAVIIGISGITTLPIAVATRREKGVLRRFSATPLKPITYFLADTLVPFVMTILGISLLFLTGKIIYNVRFEGQLFSMFMAVSLSTLAFFALGYALASLLPTARAAIVVGNVLIIPMNILSGALIPMEVLPETVSNVSRFIPLTHVVTLLRGLWMAESWGNHLTEVMVLAGMLLIGTMIVSRTFRWE